MTTAESHLVEWVFKGLLRFPGKVKGLGTVSIIKPPCPLVSGTAYHFCRRQEQSEAVSLLQRSRHDKDKVIY